MNPRLTYDLFEFGTRSSQTVPTHAGLRIHRADLFRIPGGGFPLQVSNPSGLWLMTMSMKTRATGESRRRWVREIARLPGGAFWNLDEARDQPQLRSSAAYGTAETTRRA